MNYYIMYKGETQKMNMDVENKLAIGDVVLSNISGSEGIVVDIEKDRGNNIYTVAWMNDVDNQITYEFDRSIQKVVLD